MFRCKFIPGHYVLCLASTIPWEPLGCYDCRFSSRRATKSPGTASPRVFTGDNFIKVKRTDAPKTPPCFHQETIHQSPWMAMPTGASDAPLSLPSLNHFRSTVTLFGTEKPPGYRDVTALVGPFRASRSASPGSSWPHCDIQASWD